MEITVRTIQSRYLLRPSEELNRLVVGVLAHALRSHRVKLHAAVFLSTHAHLHLTADSVEEMANFMRLVSASISREVGKIHNWTGAMWARRYTSVPVSDEPEEQIARLRYILSNSAKEGLALSPFDWPGVHCAAALVQGEPLQGVWIDRTAFHEARKRGQDVSIEDYEENLELHFEPLPCWAHLEEKVWRDHVADLVREIEGETLEMHRRNGTVPAGARAVQRVHPHQRPERESRSPKPMFHASAIDVWKKMKEAFSVFLADYADAAERLRSGDPNPRFPPNCFRRVYRSCRPGKRLQPGSHSFGCLTDFEPHHSSSSAPNFEESDGRSAPVGLKLPVHLRFRSLRPREEPILGGILESGVGLWSPPGALADGSPRFRTRDFPKMTVNHRQTLSSARCEARSAFARLAVFCAAADLESLEVSSSLPIQGSLANFGCQLVRDVLNLIR